MQALILAGGFGSRLSEETDKIPKPMVEIGGKPILWHIMNCYSKYGITDFVVLLGYKGEIIKKYFVDYLTTVSDLRVNLQKRQITSINSMAEDWDITLLDTGLNTMTGGRIKRAIESLKIDSTFCLTYGDGLSNINIRNLVELHKTHGKVATVTAVTPPGRFGILNIDAGGNVSGFQEKIVSEDYRINGGFFVLEPEIKNYIDDDLTIFEEAPMKRLVSDNQLVASKHDGFWQPMDTLREKNILEELWQSGNPPWVKGV